MSSLEAFSRIQCDKLKARREIRLATVFHDAPATFLKMIVVHGLAHLKDGDHNKAFHQQRTHMAADQHQRELDSRVYLTHLETGGSAGGHRHA